MIRKILTGAGYVAWGAIVFAAGIYLFFPSSLAVKRLAWEVSERTDGNWQIQAESAKPWRLTGLSLDEVDVFKIKGENATRLVHLDDANARIRLLPLISLTPDIGFDIDLYDGNIQGHIAPTKAIDAEVFVEEVNLGKIPLVGDNWELDLGGKLKSEIELALDAEDTKKSTGKIDFEIINLVVNSGKIAGFDLPADTQFEQAVLSLRLKDGKAKVQKGEFVSELIKLTIDGVITLNKDFLRSRLRLDLVCTFDESIDSMAKVFLKDARSPDGKYTFQVTGTIERPNFRSKSSRKPVKRSTTRPAPVAGGDVESIDERERLREERIKERRERLKARRDEKIKEEPIRDDELPNIPLDDEPGYDEEEFFDEPPFEEERHDYQPPPQDFDVEMNPVPFDEYQE